MKIFGFGMLLWFWPFATGMLVFGLKEGSPQLFDGIMVLSLATAAVVLGSKYLKGVPATSLRHGATVGMVWAGMAVLLDLPFFLYGPPHMVLSSYAVDIGMNYLMVPITTAGLGACLAARDRLVS